MENNFLVRVDCITYNHAPYITDTMDGFCMQITTFPFVCTIIDDASTDGEPEVIKKYLKEHFDLDDKDVARFEDTDDYHLVFARHKTNHNCFFAVLFLKYNHYSVKKPKREYIKEWRDAEYVAFCEGDDYWIHPDKLQLQVNYLKANPDCGLVHTHVKELVQSTLSFNKKMGGFEITDEDIYFIYNPIRTLSVCCKQEYITRYNQEIGKYHSWQMGDFQLWLYILMNSRIHFIPEVTGVYRILDESAVHSRDINKVASFLYSSLDAHLFMANYYHKGYLSYKIKTEYLGRLLARYNEYGESLSFIKCLKRFGLAVFHLGYLKAFFKMYFHE